MSGFLAWLAAIGEDANPDKAGFQAQGMYLVACVVLPIAFGIVVAGLLNLLEKVFGIKLAKGGH